MVRRLAYVLVVLCLHGISTAATISFSAGDIKNTMLSYGTALHRGDGYPYYGIKAAVMGIRVMPVVTGGGYTITGGATDQTNWMATWPDIPNSTWDFTTPYYDN